MSLFTALGCRCFNRHTWRTEYLYYKTLNAVLCTHCGQPKTVRDRQKLEVSVKLAEEFGDQTAVAPYGVICVRAAALLKERFAVKRPITYIS